MSATELLPIVASSSAGERARLVRRTRRLAWAGIAWHFVEFGIAFAAGIAASSIALIGFGVDSLIEAAAGFVVVWLFASRRSDSAGAERRAQQLIAVSFFLLAAYILIDSSRSLLQGDHAAVSWLGIGLAAVTAPTMPLLSRMKANLGRQLGSPAAVSEGAQTMLCAYLSLALLAGLGANALLGWWWADPLTALVIGGVAIMEGLSGWRGQADACCAPIVVSTEPSAGYDDSCCQ